MHRVISHKIIPFAFEAKPLISVYAEERFLTKKSPYLSIRGRFLIKQFYYIGKNFNDRYWKYDEKETPVPFSPDVYRENGYMKIEEGKIIEKTLTIRDT